MTLALKVAKIENFENDHISKMILQQVFFEGIYKVAPVRARIAVPPAVRIGNAKLIRLGLV